MADLPLDIVVQAKGAAQAATQINAVDRAVAKVAATGRGGIGTTLGTGLAKGVGAAEKSVNKLGGALGHAQRQVTGLLSGPLGLVGLGTGIFGVAGAFDASIGGATRFNAAMELLRTQTGATQAEVDSMSQSVLSLAGTVPQGPEALAAGLYHVESAGYRGAKALDLLKVAAQGAMTGNADLESVTNALVGAEQSGVKGAENLQTAMGTLNAIVGAGNMRMQDLVDSMGSGILASARTFGVSLQSVGAAIATMTDEGIPAIDAATRLRMTLSLIGAPTSKAAKELASIGLGSLDLANAMRSPGGLVAAVGELRDHMVKAGLIGPDGNPNAAGADLLSRAFGGGRSSAAIMTLVTNFGLLEQKQKAVDAGGARFGEDVAAAAAQAQNKMAAFTSELQATAIKVGNVLLPIMTDAVQALGSWVASHQDEIVGWAKDLGQAAREAGGFIQDDVIPAVKAIAGAWNSLPGPLRDLLVKGFVAGKVSKFLFDFGPMDAAKMLAGMVKGVLGIKAAVVNVSGGVVNNGGLPTGGAAGAAEGQAASGGLKSLIGPIAAVAGGLAIAAVFKQIAIDPGLKQQTAGIQTSAQSLANSGDLAAIKNALIATDVGIEQLKHQNGLPGPVAEFVNGQQISDLTQTRQTLQAGLDRIANDQMGAGIQAHHDTDKLDGTVAGGLAAVKGGVAKLQDAIHLDFSSSLHTLKEATDPKKAIDAAMHVAADILKGIGNTTNTKATIDELVRLRDIAIKNGDKADVSKLNRAISEATNRLDNRRILDAIHTKEDGVLRSNLTNAGKIDALKALQAQIGSRSDVASARIAGEIARLKLNPTIVDRPTIIVTINGQKVNVAAPHYDPGHGGYVPGKRAAGGPVAAGTPYIVGEEGPETFIPHVSGEIVPRRYSPIGLAGIRQALTVQVQVNLQSRANVSARETERATTSVSRWGKVIPE